MERIAGDRGIDWTHVPFRGFADNLQALLGGQTEALADSSGWAELARAGQLRLLVVWSEERAKGFPEAPTLREAGVDIVSASPDCIAGRQGMDPGLGRALGGGQPDALADSSGWAELVRSGQLRLLVVWSEERAKGFPEAPTLREAGIDIVSASPYGIAGPKGMDPGLVRALHDAFREALFDPAHLAILERFDMPVMHKD